MAELSDLTIGIVGGAGRMGSFFLSELQKLGHKNLLFSDIDDERASVLKFERTFNEDLAARCDVTVVSVPLDTIPEVAQEIVPYIKGGAIASHFGTVQRPGLRALASRDGYDVIGIHPMFNNTVSSMEGRNIALIPYRYNRGLETLQGILEPTGANLRIMEPEKHDLISLCSQNLLHFNTILLAAAFREFSNCYGVTRTDLDLLQTPNLALGRLVMGRLFSTGNSGLYADIQMQNPDAEKMLDIYEQVFFKLSKFVREKKKGYFMNFFEKLRRSIGGVHMAWSERASNQVIELLRDMESYTSVVDEGDRALKEYYSGQYQNALVEAGCIGDGHLDPKLKRLSNIFGNIGIELGKEDYSKARSEAGKLMHLAELNRAKFRKGYKGLIEASNEFISRCDSVLEALDEMPYLRPNGNH